MNSVSSEPVSKLRTEGTASEREREGEREAGGVRGRWEAQTLGGTSDSTPGPRRRHAGRPPGSRAVYPQARRQAGAGVLPLAKHRQAASPSILA